MQDYFLATGAGDTNEVCSYLEGVVFFYFLFLSINYP